ncbi:RHS repeat domain-containing protein [Sphingopyxis macrogoltabida]|uniref:RHS repeat domain-containing protein n=1 Tax=Sphingopyxis macrogoltabida TaxID=33050 RepID=UPI0006ED45DF|nr:RHS repeat-associated core domain-containing protein [Sphingopyxis macrogoltabida]ALJ11563.1 YD repeat protein [Sphingopyxis macrogoltabida]
MAIIKNKYAIVSRAALCASTILGVGLAPQLWAQATPPPIRSAIDENGVDVITGNLNLAQTDLSIGADARQGMVFRRTNNGTGWWNNLVGSIDKQGIAFTVSFDGFTDRFLLSGSTYTPTEANGAALTKSGTTYTYTGRDGTVATFAAQGDKFQVFSGNEARITSIVYPNGAKLSFDYDLAGYCEGEIEGGECTGQRVRLARLTSAVHSNGYRLLPSYETDFFSPETVPSWLKVQSVKAINLGVEYCSSSCTNSWPTASYSSSSPGGGLTYNFVTDAGGEQTRYTTSGGKIVGIKRPGASADNVQVTYTSNRVSSITSEGVTYGYSYADSGATRTTTVTAPDSSQRIYVSNTTTARLTSFTDELTRTTSYLYDTDGRVTRITSAEGNYTQLTYDGRGNVTQTQNVAKSGSGLAAITTSASFPASCTNAKTCNQPATSTNAMGDVTDYTYNSTHGGVATITLPAAASGGIRPQQRISYTGLTAYFKNSAGSIVSSGQTTYVPTQSAACQTTASCANGADETKTVVGYGPQTAGTANNLLPVSVTSSSGNGSVSSATALGYDMVGNRITIDGPLTGTADTTRYRYDGARRVVGVVAPDPDGAGSRVHKAEKFTYNDDGQVTLAEVGTVTSQTDPAWAAFSSQQQVATTYDANARPVRSELKSGGTTYAVSQTSYDALGRVDCAVTRMDPAQWASQPNACLPQTSNTTTGADRVVKTSYTDAGEVAQVQTAYGTTAVANEVTNTYSNNGRLASVKDAENNLTTYIYDGHDRLSQTRFPSTTKGAGTSNAANYEQLTYNANGAVTQRRLRDAQTIGYSYDDLGRVTLKNLPGTELDVSYSYDLLGRPTQASQTGNILGFTYDALSRNLTQSGPLGTTTYTYDAAGRRLTMAYPGTTALTLNYDYDVTGNVTKIRENGATSGVGVLGTYAYDSLGRRTTLTRGNATVTSYSFDPVSRLSSLTQNLAGTASDLTIGSITYNAASQIVSQQRSNDAYAWTAHYNVDRSYVANGLNQTTSAGGTAIGYDTRGNLTSSGTDSYTYSSENLLKTGPGSATLAYDPALRLYQTVGTATTRFQYDGPSLIAEYNGSNVLQRRFVHGPGVDEPLVWYEGTGLTDRRWYHADERGSIVAVSNGSGAALGINAYDEYGIPASTNLGRFQYTGQTWLPELGLYYYKARIYSPTLGRFMQTDPIGYADGMNWYNYVGSDPVNFIDPTGLLNACDANRDCPKPTGYDLDYAAQENLRWDKELVVNGTKQENGPSDPIPVYAGGGPNPNGMGYGGYDGEAIVVLGERHKQQSRRFNGCASAACMVMASNEHTKNKRPSTKGKHEKGKARKGTDRGGEKGDEGRRAPRTRPPGWKGPWPMRMFPPLLIPDFMLDPCWSGNPAREATCGDLIAAVDATGTG